MGSVDHWEIPIKNRVSPDCFRSLGKGIGLTSALMGKGSWRKCSNVYTDTFSFLTPFPPFPFSKVNPEKKKNKFEPGENPEEGEVELNYYAQTLLEEDPEPSSPSSMFQDAPEWAKAVEEPSEEPSDANFDDRVLDATLMFLLTTGSGIPDPKDSSGFGEFFDLYKEDKEWREVYDRPLIDPYY